jgi:DNA-binding PadR family transcriptional regulator
MVLVLLAEQPMHPYEMQRVMQWRGKDQVVRVQRGSLYPAVERLVKAGLIEPSEVERDGRRPERTVYRLTDDGGETAFAWLTDMLRTVRNEYPEFPAALSFMPLLSVGDVRANLRLRALGLGKQIAAFKSEAVDLAERFRLPRLFALEDEYRLAMAEAEQAWVLSLLDEMDSRALTWDTEQIRAWAQGMQDELGSFPGIPRAVTEAREADP